MGCQVSHQRADVPGTGLVTAVRRLAVTALVVSLAGLAVPAADAASAPLRRKPHTAAAAAAKAKAAKPAKAAKAAKAARAARAARAAEARARAKPRPGPRGHQSTGGARTGAAQHNSGNGRYIQNLNGVSTPSLLSGPQSTTVTSAGSITSQGAYCSGGDSCDVSQIMR
ncbi:hypothetical protein GCM10010116_49890 [Microbispora rosea subsp. aerata]|nr:hypothetical protein GCM10010116_49890 [Microbispora rosea subsp. aerata]GIH58001.1 hypothetical protein Mro02_49150 [Microbispora rosea subsp. aerata]GLJ81498.1 hypothetical protein GCM10017588_02220 [Microbispora rosea subsp. aerata]